MADKIRKRLIKRKQGSKSNPIEDKKVKEKVRLKAPKKRIASIPKKPALNIKFIDYPSYKESRADTSTPMKKQRLTDMDDALQQKGPTVLLDKSMKQNYKTGGKVKLALRGGGRAYGKNG